MVSAVVDRGNGGPWEWRTPGMADLNQIKYCPVWLGLRWGVNTNVRWQVTLCDRIW